MKALNTDKLNHLLPTMLNYPPIMHPVIRVLIILILWMGMGVMAGMVYAQDCNVGCDEVYVAGGNNKNNVCQPVFGLNTVQGFACLGKPKCVTFNRKFTLNPSVTLYVFTWGDGLVDTLTHAALLAIPEKEDAITGDKFRKVCHAYEETTCPEDSTYVLKVELVNPNGGCENGISSNIKVLAPVEVDYSVPDFVCINQPFGITNTSVEGYNDDCTQDATYQWDFNNDGSIDQTTQGVAESVTHAGYSTPGPRKIKLMGFQSPQKACGTDTTVKTVTVLDVPEPRFTIGADAELMTISSCDAANVFTFKPATRACVDISLPLENISDSRNATTKFTWEVKPAVGAVFQNSDLTADTNTITFQQAGTYQVWLHVQDECADGLTGENQACVTVVVKDVAQPAIVVAAAQCAGETLDATITFTGAVPAPTDVVGITWTVQKLSTGGDPVPAFTNGQQTLTIPGMPGGTYEVQLAYETICGVITAKPQTVEVVSPPAGTLTANKPSVCPDETLVLTANYAGADTYVWYLGGAVIAGESSATLTQTLTTPGTYSYRLEAAKGTCTTTSEAVSVTVQTPPSADGIVVSKDWFCQDETVSFTLTAQNVTPAEATLQWQQCTVCDGSDWSNVPAATATVYQGTAPGHYRLQVAGPACDFFTPPVEVIQRQAINPVIQGGGGTVCAGSGQTLQVVAIVPPAGVAYQYQWFKDNVAIIDATLDQHAAIEAGSYSVQVTQDDVCAETSAPVQVSVNTLPTFSGTGPTVYCAGEPIDLAFSSATPNLTYHWQAQTNTAVSPASASGTGAITALLQNQSAAVQDVTFEVTAKDPATGCESLPVAFTVSLAPALTLAVPTEQEICDGQNFQVAIATPVTEALDYAITVTAADPAIAGATHVTAPAQTGGYTFTQLLTNASNAVATATYTVTASLTHDGVTCQSPTYPWLMKVKPTPNLVFDAATADTVVCSGETLQVALQTDPPGATITTTALDNAAITGETNQTGNTLLQTLVSSNHHQAELVTYQIAIQAEGCSGLARTITAVVNPEPAITLFSSQNDTIVCGPGAFESMVTAGSSVAGATFAWTDGAAQPVSAQATMQTSEIDTYTVTVTTPAQCKASRSVAIERRNLALPVIDTIGLSTPHAVACAGDTVFLSVAPDGLASITSYAWAYNGTAITGANAATLPATQSGQYSVLINQETPCPEQANAMVLFPPTPAPQISGLPAALCPDIETLPLQALNTNPAATITAYAWSVTPTTAATLSATDIAAPNLTLNDNASGTDVHFTVTLTLFTDAGCEHSATQAVTLTSRPVAAFQADTAVCERMPLPLADASTFADSLRWTVSPATGVTINDPRAANPVITFADNAHRSAVAVYTLQQTAYRQGCEATAQQIIGVHPAPQADFTKSITPDNGCGPVNAVFTSTTTGVDLAYLWDFGNGTTAANVTAATAAFMADSVSRRYIISLEASSAVCPASTAYDTIRIRPNPTIASVLFAPTMPICADYPLQVNYVVIGQPDTVWFDFGDAANVSANLVTSTDSTGFVEHIYRNDTRKDTVFTLTVIAQSACAVDTLSRRVTVSPNRVTAFYEVDTATVCAHSRVQFTSNQVAGSGNQVFWDWGDGTLTTDSLQVTRTYDAAGMFYPALIVKNGCHVDTCSQITNPPCGASVTVLETPSAAFTITNKPCDGVPVTYRNDSSPLTSSTWSLGDGTLVTQRTPTPHIYPGTGPYTVQLMAVNEHACKDSATQVMTVSPLPVPAFSFPEAPYCERDTLYVRNHSTGAVSYAWHIPTLGLTDIGATPGLPFPQAGTYDVWLTAYDEADQRGCADSVRQTLRIGERPQPTFSLQLTAVDCGVASVQIDHQTQVPTENQALWYWNLGNGQSHDGFLQNYVQTYPNFDKSDQEIFVTLTVVHVNGCEAVETESLVLPGFREDVVLPPGGQTICFTPGQPPNHEFRLRYDNVEETQFKMTIYNEWGNMVFTTEDITAGWNGNYNGRQAAVGAYMAEVILRGCNSQQIKKRYIPLCIRN